MVRILDDGVSVTVCTLHPHDYCPRLILHCRSRVLTDHVWRICHYCCHRSGPVDSARDMAVRVAPEVGKQHHCYTYPLTSHSPTRIRPSRHRKLPLSMNFLTHHISFSSRYRNRSLSNAFAHTSSEISSSCSTRIVCPFLATIFCIPLVHSITT